MSNTVYDYIIVGGGISGLYFAYKILLLNPQLSVLILEKTDKVGGKIKPLHFPIIQKSNKSGIY